MTGLPADLTEDLRAGLELYREVARVVEAESQTLRQPDVGSVFVQYTARKRLMPSLDQSLQRLRAHRAAWLRATVEERRRHPEVGQLLRQSQDTIMRILVLDRENEQALLRRGLLGPRDLPAYQRQRPHFVADMYRRQGGSGAP